MPRRRWNPRWPRQGRRTLFSSPDRCTWWANCGMRGTRAEKSHRDRKDRRMGLLSGCCRPRGRRSVLWERRITRAKIERMEKTSATGDKPKKPLVGIIMGSTSDWETMEHAASTLRELGVPHETRVVSAHRTPDLPFEYAASAEKRGIEVIIAGAGGAAHLPGMTASKTALPVLGVPVESKALKGL